MAWRRWIAIPAILIGGALVIASALGRSAALPGYTADWRAERAPVSSAALVATGYRALDASDLQTAQADAVRALNLSPLDDRALELLVRVRDAQRRWTEEKRLLALSTRLTKRNLPLRFMNMSAAAERGAFGEAVRDADLLLRQGAYEDQIYAYLRAASAYPEARAAIVQRLAAKPQWRGRFLSGRHEVTPDDHADLLVILRGLAHTAAPPTIKEITPFAQTLVAAGEVDLARAVRDGFAPRLRDAPILDTRFVHAGDNAGGLLGWTLPGASASDPSGQGLPIGLYGSGAIATQILFLPAGRHVLTWTTRGFRTPPDLQWTLACIDKGAPPVTGLVRATRTSDEFVMMQPIDVAGNCRGQRLSLYYAKTDDDEVAGRLIATNVLPPPKSSASD